MAKIKDKERILKASREKQLVIYKKSLIRLWGDFLAKTLQSRRAWHDIFKKQNKKKTYKQEYSAWQGYHSELKEWYGVWQTSKS